LRDVYEALREKRAVAYTTVMTMMRILEEKGYLKKTLVDRAHVYRPTKPRQQVRRGARPRVHRARLRWRTGPTAAPPGEGTKHSPTNNAHDQTADRGGRGMIDPDQYPPLQHARRVVTAIAAVVFAAVPRQHCHRSLRVLGARCWRCACCSHGSRCGRRQRRSSTPARPGPNFLSIASTAEALTRRSGIEWSTLVVPLLVLGAMLRLTWIASRSIETSAAALCGKRCSPLGSDMVVRDSIAIGADIR
jgi:hypothetical protein